MPDFFHLIHEIVKSYSLAIGRRWRQAHQELTEAQEALARRQGLLQAAQAPPRPRALVASEASRGDALGRGAPHLSAPFRDPLAHAASLPSSSGSAPQTSAQVASRLQAAVEAIEAFARRPSVADPSGRHDQGPQAITSPGGPGGLLVARCPAGIGAHAACRPRWEQWVKSACSHGLLGAPSARTRCRRRKAKLQQALEAMRRHLSSTPSPSSLPPQVLAEWHAWANPPGQRLSARLVGRRRAQRLSVADAS